MRLEWDQNGVAFVPSNLQTLNFLGEVDGMDEWNRILIHGGKGRGDGGAKG